ncbi:FAD-dependent oxidoreductase [Roseibium marinum]|uniref:FAD dependent oxidoreductase n=1 Tax=Roseibium marinum TaxID=281252 RepID=A0A2S3UXG2_9HYPH|nr:FAD-dependent oxidoreductase [Roseibium marinum]POF32397.1 FAD dependent oxidoreductase [Roseibium marinum]
MTTPTIHEASREAKIVDKTDVVVVGGGPAGIAAAVSAARNGASVTLLERYPYLGGLASGGMVLILDDMHNNTEITVKGICLEMIEQMRSWGLCVVPPMQDRMPITRETDQMWRKWARWGLFDFHTNSMPHPICFAAAFDPDAFKRSSYALTAGANVKLRLHSWFSSSIVEDGVIKGVICETKEGRQAILGDVVIDTSGDLDVAASAGARFEESSFILTTVSRWGGVDTDAAEEFQFSEPEKFAELDHQAKRIIGGCWNFWWLKTPLPGIIWLNCPHMPKYSGIRVADLTAAELDGRERMQRLMEFARANLPGFEKAYVVDFAPQTGVRQTRQLVGEYVVTKDDVMNRRHFTDSVCRGRDYYTPYRAMVPRDVDQLLVAGRHYSATPQAQKSSREIPPCMAMGEAAGIAATVALNAGVPVRDADVAAIQKQMRAQGADPGDVPSANANMLEAAE